MDEEINDFLDERRATKAARNSSEFLSDSTNGKPAMERLEVKEFQRSVIAVDNVEGPALTKSIAHNESTLEAINEQRVGELEGLLKVPRKDGAVTIGERIKILEDKILWIEEHYPQVAYTCFDYSQDKVQEKRGRVTRPKHYSHPVDASPDTEADTGKEILRRMEELRKKLKKQ